MNPAEAPRHLNDPAHEGVPQRDVWRIVGPYAAFSGAWILLSDHALTLLPLDLQQLALVSVLKGWLFVLVTSFFLYGLIRHRVRAYNASVRLLRSREAELLASKNLISDATQRLQATLDALPDLLFEVDGDGRIHQYHSHRTDLLAAPPEVFIGRLFSDILPAEASRICREALDTADAQGYCTGLRYALDLPQGTRWFELSVSRMAAAPVQGHRFIFIARDVTDRQLAEKQLEIAGRVFRHAREGIMVTDPEGHIIEVNASFTRITGYTEDEARGRTPNFLSSGRQSAEFYGALWTSLKETGTWSGEIWNRRKDGEVYAELLTISAVRNSTGEVIQYVALFSDITALKNYQTELEHIAHFDILTGLPNRLLLTDRMQQAMSQSVRRAQRMAVAYLDLDGFKEVNDQHGHAMGDKLLVALAQRMRDVMREGDTLARIGGDEFVAVLIDLGEQDAGLPWITRMLRAAADPFVLEGRSLQISASVGVALYPQVQNLDADQLLRQADQAMYQAKVAGKNRFHVFDAQQDNSLRSHHEGLERVRRALRDQEFELHYQPKVHMRQGQVLGVEALIRWRHPDRGLLSPAAFLPLVENDPLAVDLGDWVLRTALEQHVRWLDHGLHLPVSVNVGALQLQQPDFVDRLQRLLQVHPRVQPHRLQIEILETSALQDMEQVAKVIAACQRLGVDFALDDFGTGYSSLTYLRRLDVDQIKIDQSFVRDMLVNPEDQTILRGVIGLAQAFRIDAIAEGVESAAHGAMLLQLGCERAQGFGIARPMAAHAIEGWVRQWKPDPSWT